MGDQYDSYVFLTVKLADRINDFLASFGVKHCRWFIQNYALWLHGKNTCYGYPLLLATGKT